MTFPEVSEQAARHIVQRMGETGQPPERGALAVNVGTDEMLDILRREYLVPIRDQGRNSSFKLVQAPFGGGKTQFLHCLREVAWELGFVSALVGVSPDECPFDDPRKIYQAVARSLELPPENPDVEPQPGLEVVLRQIALDRAERYGKDELESWLREELGRARVESVAFRRAVILYMKAVLNQDYDTEDLLAAYMRGEKTSAGELSVLQIREQPDDTTAFRFLRSVVQVLRALELPGVVLLFDELDRVMSLSVKRRKAIGDNLRQMIDHCGQSTLPSLLWAYAVPPEFMTNVVPEYPALEQRLKGAARFSSASPLQPIIDLDRLPIDPVDLFEEIGKRLLGLYERGFDHRFDHAVQDHNLHELAVELGANQLESGTRRSFVKSVVNLLQEQAHSGCQRVEGGDVRRLARRSSVEEPGPLDGEEDIF